jgi:DNA-directed RNA polymerase specialized sigma subunit
MYVHGKTQGQTAELLDCSKSRISYLHKEAVTILRDSVRHPSPARKSK